MSWTFPPSVSRPVRCKSFTLQNAPFDDIKRAHYGSSKFLIRHTEQQATIPNATCHLVWFLLFIEFDHIPYSLIFLPFVIPFRLVDDDVCDVREVYEARLLHDWSWRHRSNIHDPISKTCRIRCELCSFCVEDATQGSWFHTAPLCSPPTHTVGGLLLHVAFSSSVKTNNIINWHRFVDSCENTRKITHDTTRKYNMC